MSESQNPMDNNPFIPRPDYYFAGYNKSIEENFGKQQKEALASQQLAYEVFHNDKGRAWIAFMKEYLNRKICEINLQCNNAELLLTELRGKLMQILEIEMTVTAHLNFINSQKG